LRLVEPLVIYNTYVPPNHNKVNDYDKL